MASPVPPLSFTGGAAGPSGVYGAPVHVGGLTVPERNDYSQYALLGLMALSLFLLVKK